MVSFGISASLSSVIFGKLSEYTGRAIMFIGAASINVACLIYLLYWKPDPEKPILFFVVAAAWGLADGVWSPQIKSLYGSLFSKTREAGYSNSCLWMSIGFTIVYLNASMTCMTVKIYIYLVILAVGVIGYCIVEFISRPR